MWFDEPAIVDKFVLHLELIAYLYKLSVEFSLLSLLGGCKKKVVYSF